MASGSRTEQKLIGAWDSDDTGDLLEAFNKNLLRHQEDGWELVWLEVVPVDHLTIIGLMERDKE